MRTRAAIVSLSLASLLFAMPARADEPAEPAPPATEPADEARSHHRRGLELYDEGEFRLALIEFERAYAVGNNYKILYNIGQVHFQLNNYARARLVLEQYLRDAGDIAPKRRQDVEKDLVTLRARTATLTVRVNVGDAEVMINQTLAGKAPLEGVLVDAGTLRVQVTRKGYASRIREITLAGGDQQVVTIDLLETRPDMVVTQVSTGLPGPAIAGWIVTGVLVAGAVGTGIAAAGAKSEYDTKRTTPISGSPAEARADLERQRDRVSALALTTDILAATAIVAAGVSLYLTLRDKPKPDAPQVRVQGAGAVFSVGF
jgi:tetratricopeptide (TPR) repeat protein